MEVGEKGKDSGVWGGKQGRAGEILQDAKRLKRNVRRIGRWTKDGGIDGARRRRRVSRDESEEGGMMGGRGNDRAEAGKSGDE